MNFRANPNVIEAVLPAPFRPRTHGGFAIVGICLIRLEHERPVGMPEAFGMSSENAAHRIAVEWTDGDGQIRHGVYVPRRDTNSIPQRLAGGRLFSVKSRAATVSVSDLNGRIAMRVRSADGDGSIEVVGQEADFFPESSCFESLAQSSEFFEQGSVGYSPIDGKPGFDGVELWTPYWQVRLLAVERVHSSYFQNLGRFPAGSVEFDHALVMRDIEHEWRTLPQMDANADSPK